MPSGRTHEIVNLTVYAAAAVGYTYAEEQGLGAEWRALLTPELLTAVSVSYLVGTFLVTPDLDLAENYMRARNNWGLLGLLWVPYGMMFSHRGLSHTWLVGPLTRLVYLALVVFALGWSVSVLGPYFGYRFSSTFSLNERWRELAVGALAGYYLSQWLHLIADGVQPDHALRGRGKRKRRS